MASNIVYIKIVGAGKSRFGLWLLGFIARLFSIELDVKVAHDCH